MNQHKTVLVTGCNGALGACLVNYLRKEYPSMKIINLDAVTYAANREFMKQPRENYTFYHGSVNNYNLIEYILETEQPTMVIHMAAESHVDSSFKSGLLFTETNVLGTHTLLECVKNYGKCQLILHMSTDEVMGPANDNETFHENSLFCPTNPYASSKAAAEMVISSFIKSFKMPIIILRANNGISPYQHAQKLIPLCIETLLERLETGKDLRIPIHGEGKARRTFIHGDDIARAIDTVITKGTPGRIYNIGCGPEMERSVMEVVDTIVRKMVGEDARVEDYIEFINDRPFQDLRYSLNTSALRALGWSETISFEEAIDDVINYKREQRNRQKLMPPGDPSTQ